jgi:hypothetical protein
MKVDGKTVTKVNVGSSSKIWKRSPINKGIYFLSQGFIEGHVARELFRGYRSKYFITRGPGNVLYHLSQGGPAGWIARKMVGHKYDTIKASREFGSGRKSRRKSRRRSGRKSRRRSGKKSRSGRKSSK